MSEGRSGRRHAMVDTRWVHVDGDDTEAGAVYRDASGNIPLSRRPKEFLEFDDDGTVRKLATGADDRAHETDRTHWSDASGMVVFAFAAPDARGAMTYRVVQQTPDILVIARS